MEELGGAPVQPAAQAGPDSAEQTVASESVATQTPPEPLVTTAVAAPPDAPPPPAPKRRSGRRRLAIGLIALLFLLGAGAGAAYYENGVLSDRYSPQHAVLDYFAAQAKGDAAGMYANATYARPDGGYSQFFSVEAVRVMLELPENTSVSNVRVTSVQSVDSSTVRANVSMTWAGTDRTSSYTVTKDTSQTHYFFYNSWRIQIPSTTITVSLPDQPGQVAVDGIAWPAGAAAGNIQLISGYHKVTMLPTSFWQSESQTANAVSDFPAVKFKGTLSSQATSSAASAIQDAVNHHCDANVQRACNGHLYYSPGLANRIYYLELPGYPEIDYTNYAFNITGDMTTGMQLVVTAEPGKVTGSGTAKKRSQSTGTAISRSKAHGRRL